MKNFILGIVTGWIAHQWMPTIVHSAMKAYQNLDEETR